ncbi:amidase family protein [Bacillus sp. B1-b2]|uniref:amidase family protein n=1 Tax=Bacillus sp. B1-b2 TaxID=2653201 RepID=UPI0012624240|nr:amidase family protein [Bacillus sp. B1-b2]KAB7664903.1 amidase [Bacillus sp. B1-b2]
MSKYKENIEEITISELQEALHNGEITSVELTKLYLDRMKAYDNTLNAIRVINPDALSIAEELDKKRKHTSQVGPLYGIPVIIKDNIDTHDKMATTAGSIALEQNYAQEDAFIVKKLRDAGAVILGKANLSEFANFITELNMPNGYSSLGGQVMNPYGPGVWDVGGSSSGTGASIAANLAVAGIGTETSGSILSPASSNSLVGIKPTIGLVSRTGIIPLAHSQDIAGPMTRSVKDAAILLSVIAGVDTEDETTLGSANQPRDYTSFLKQDGLKGKKIGVDYSFLPENQEEAAIFQQSIDLLKNQGAIIIDVIIPKQEYESIVMFHEFKYGINKYLGNMSSEVPVHSLNEVIAFNKEHTDLVKYGQTILEHCETLSGDLNDATYLEHRAKDIQYSATEGLNVTFQEHDLDALLFAKYLGCEMPAKAGYPSVTVPAGYTEQGKPMGITFTGLAYSEPLLIEMAYSYEQHTLKRVPPVL